MSAELPLDPDLPVQERLAPRSRRRAPGLRRTLRAVRSRADLLAVIALGGALGSAARWGLAELHPRRPGAYPWATFTANLAGSLLLGVLMICVLDLLPPSRYLRPFLGVGVLGGFTTFSTAMLDTRGLLAEGHAALAGVYLFGSLISGLFGVWLGVAGTRWVLRRARRTGQRGDLR